MAGPRKQHDEPVSSGELERVIPPEIIALFEQPPLLPGESLEAYDRLLTGVGITVAPSDVIEWLWVKDIVDLLWEVQRLRRLRLALLNGARRKALAAILAAYEEPVSHSFLNGKRDMLVHAWSEGQPKALKQVEAILAKHSLTQDTIVARAFSTHIDDLDRLERMIANADARRTSVLREIERRRSGLGTRLRTASDQVITGEIIGPAESRSRLEPR